MIPKLKYYCCTILLFTIALKTYSQTVSNNATVTIIGDPILETPPANVSGNNPYINVSQPPSGDRQLASPQNIDPTFENGFHIRYEIVEQHQQLDERPANTGYEYASLSATTSSGGSSSVKSKRKHMTFTERSFNFKKRFKTWMPKRKKKYRPNICGRF